MNTFIEFISYLPCLIVMWGIGYCAYFMCFKVEKAPQNVHRGRADYA